MRFDTHPTRVMKPMLLAMLVVTLVATLASAAVWQQWRSAEVEAADGPLPRRVRAALEELARDNPSLHFRRIMWQIVNSLNSGADIGSTVKEIVDNIVAEQRTAIKKYGSELNPLALFYMILVVIFPTLGIIFLLVLFSFVGTAMSIEVILMGILAMVTFAQFMFMGIMKFRRIGLDING